MEFHSPLRREIQGFISGSSVQQSSIWCSEYHFHAVLTIESSWE